MDKALIDTDIYSEILRAVNPSVTRNATTYRRSHGVFSLSSITVTEIVRGLQRSQSMRRLNDFITAIGFEEIIPLDRDDAELAGRIAGDLERTGQRIGLSDPMIAAIAISNGLDLVTGNTAHFERIQNLGYSLNLANWRA